MSTNTVWNRAIACGIVLAFASCGEAQPAVDWPQFRGSTGQGTSAAKLPTQWSAEENIAWKQPLPGPGTSAPVVYRDKIFITCWTGFNTLPYEKGKMEDLKLHLICLDRATGKPRWKKDIEPKLPEQEQIRDDHGYASSTPAIDAERVYTFFGKTGVIAFDHAGKELWRADVGENLHGWGSAASPVLFENLVIINASVESESLCALDKRTGKEVWRVKKINESWNTPILVKVGKNTELVLAKQGHVLGLDPKTGEELRRCNTDIGWYMVPSLVEEKGVIYCIGGRSGTASLAIKTGGRGDVTESHRLWTSKMGSNVSSPLVYQGRLYFMNDNNSIAYCLEGASGKAAYEEQVPRADQIYPSPVLADGKIYYLSRSGKCYVVAAQPKFELLATNELESRGMFNASPAVDGNRLLIRSNKFLYCIGN